ncbi:MAG: hypothetical protein Q9219_003432 [cf. Caloplaca sp. 3 TL-2023]
MGNAPFLYDHPAKYSFAGPTDKAWDPKAVSRASWAASLPSPPKPKQEGPLIDAKEFNRHPDSYFVVPYGNLNWKPMSPRTRKKVKYTRHAQLCLRICELLGALGLLFCVISIKGTQGSTGWIIRVPPGVAILHTIYAIYHLARSANARTPGSSASYMVFSAIIDAGVIPFLVLTAIMAHDQYLEPTDTPGHWASLFMFTTTTTKIIEATYLISVVNGVLHLLSMIISVYLAIVFRKISKLPPDMNPLEDNLTSRHKRNKSELLDNRTSQASTAISSKRDSRADEPLISPVRSVPFMHTRNESSVDINKVPHPHFSPRTSRTNISAPFYDRPISQRSSRINTRQNTIYSQPEYPHQRTLTNTNPDPPPTTNDHNYPGSNPSPNEPTTLLRSPTKSSSIYTDDTASRPTSTRPTSTRPPSTRPFSTAPSLPPPSEYAKEDSDPDNNNWITHPSPSPSPPIEFKHLLRNSNPYHPLLPQSLSPSYENIENRTPKPLEMNPPTPVGKRFLPPTVQPPAPPPPPRRQGEGESVVPVVGGTTIDQRALMPGTGNTLGLMRGQRLDFDPPRRKQVRGGGADNVGGGVGGWSGLRQSEGGGDVGRGGGGYGGGERERERGGRVISRSGVEYGGDGSRDGGGRGGMRAREVSGKMVEEGRGVRDGGWRVVR